MFQKHEDHNNNNENHNNNNNKNNNNNNYNENNNNNNNNNIMEWQNRGPHSNQYRAFCDIYKDRRPKAIN